ncbi:Uncharacterised protein [uncultured archaeon]|nr:Uncharacterised protein [uncultured archaeon]
MTEKITTLKLEKETKERLEKLREHKRETYDDIIRKILYVLNTVREEPEKARGILEFIDEKRKRINEVEFKDKIEQKPRASIPQKQPQTRKDEKSIPKQQVKKK